MRKFALSILAIIGLPIVALGGIGFYTLNYYLFSMFVTSGNCLEALSLAITLIVIVVIGTILER